MEALIGLFLLLAAWMSYLTHRQRQQKLENKKLEKRTKYYMQELQKINATFKQKQNGKDQETTETEED